MGKSTLVSKFILDHAEYLRAAALAFVYLDFDSATIEAEHPPSILIEAAEQLAHQAPLGGRGGRTPGAMDPTFFPTWRACRNAAPR